ncbi:MAG: aminotransferase class I/II-fold pyridoxal phosphate-dependent enzyme [Propionibacteriaceae bacterium]|jgi:cystathionine beta-lyase|nr:aminotransferase class I/II-fold pyridoxal phosphate-dependent enzyme [Propionibacteriaceae bacterium]
MTVFDVPLETLRQRQSMKWTRFPADVLPLWVAEADCHPSPAVRAALARAVEIGDFGYHGAPSLQPAWRRYAADAWGLELAADQVETCGDVMGGITSVIRHLTPAGAAIASTTPVYAPFRSAGGLDGRRLVTVDMTPAGRLDLPALADLFARDRPAAFLLCHPYNPHGTIATPAELAELAALANRYGVTVVADEIHALVVDPAAGFTPYVAVPGADTAFTVASASKGFSLAGLRAGLIIAGRRRVDDLKRLPYEDKAGVTGHLGMLAQTAALDHDRAWLADLNAEVAANKRLLAGLLAPLGLAYEPSPATYLAWVDCSPLGLADPTAHCLRHGRVAFSPGTDFDARAKQWTRINVATSPAILAEAVRRLEAALAAG